MDCIGSTHAFLKRASRIPALGAGLSVDLYAPDLYELTEALKARRLPYGYLEIFKATSSACAQARQRLAVPLAYHAEGLWVTQPDLREAYPVNDELRAAAAQAGALQAHWLTHECASKQMGGYSFGTYLPPLFTVAGAQVVAENVRYVQAELDGLLADARMPTPLVLLETPPLTYFAFGDLDVAEFFATVVAHAPCGLVLDIGHLWTIYRYTGAWKHRSLEAFVVDFLDRFPLDRVVEIHLGGLGLHRSASEPARCSLQPARLIDAHEQPIPVMLFDLFEQVISSPGLQNLRGVALEVDNKPIELILEEYDRFLDRFAHRIARRQRADEQPTEPARSRLDRTPEKELGGQYTLYAQTVSGMATDCCLSSPSDPDDLAYYRDVYLPHEIMTWGGDLQTMFPATCRALDRAGIAVTGFLHYWFREPRSARPYDFFVLKLTRFVEYIDEVLPSASDLVRQEAAVLQEGYADACR